MQCLLCLAGGALTGVGLDAQHELLSALPGHHLCLNSSGFWSPSECPGFCRLDFYHRFLTFSFLLQDFYYCKAISCFLVLSFEVFLSM